MLEGESHECSIKKNMRMIHVFPEICTIYGSAFFTNPGHDGIDSTVVSSAIAMTNRPCQAVRRA
ncbi:hypothetical protein A6U85_02125 [Agrobacterium sp. 13-626]|nr:hypothetical protein DXT98_06130 [Agrobacterium sp. ICMP 7243]MQB29974.1 hypothetical protein [Rhizobium rhizogenes]OCJ05799.1 hypothetical protein A6U85_02125 [Agrobacterium sp. 13-626]OCJ25994.1 hypothetical protein A6U88_06085 [Agrobacterium sp. B131/95]OCJ30908.1 hypothetical protein A6U89_00410 [Agrobacterium sp. B133/95]